MTFYRSLLFQNIDVQGDILKHPTAMAEAYTLGKELVLESSE